MSERRRPRGGSRVLPPGALPCVWMTAGLLAYKLCDRDYDCEHCPLDAALAGTDAGAAPEIEMSVERWEFPDDRRYHRTHGWVKAVSGEQVRFGLDAFAARLLALVTSVVLPSPGSPMSQGSAACWLQDDGELLPVCAPVSGTVLRVNRRVQERPGLIASSPYDEGWLLEARCRLEAEPGLTTAGEQRQMATRQSRKLRRSASRRMAGGNRVGATAADGGEPLTELRVILGTSRYHRLILPFLA